MNHTLPTEQSGIGRRNIVLSIGAVIIIFLLVLLIARHGGTKNGDPMQQAPTKQAATADKTIVNATTTGFLGVPPTQLTTSQLGTINTNLQTEGYHFLNASGGYIISQGDVTGTIYWGRTLKSTSSFSIKSYATKIDQTGNTDQHTFTTSSLSDKHIKASDGKSYPLTCIGVTVKYPDEDTPQSSANCIGDIGTSSMFVAANGLTTVDEASGQLDQFLAATTLSLE